MVIIIDRIASFYPRMRIKGLDQELNPGPLAPEARIIPRDPQASLTENIYFILFIFKNYCSW